MRVARQAPAAATGRLVCELKAKRQNEGEDTLEKRLPIAKQLKVRCFILKIDGDGTVCLVSVWLLCPCVSPQVIRSRQRMRHDGGNTWKYQDHHEGLRTLPRNSGELRIRQKKTADEENLPQSSQVEIFPALMPHPEPEPLSEPALDPGILTRKAPKDDHGYGKEQHERERALPPGLPPGNDRRNENPGRQVGRGHPKDRELDMPGAQNIKGEHVRQIKTKKRAWLRAIVRDEPSCQHLEKK